MLGPRHGRFRETQNSKEIEAEKDLEVASIEEGEVIDFTQGDIKKVLDCVDPKYHDDLKFYILNYQEEIKPQSYPLIVIGTFILWVTWLYFNGGSTYSIFLPVANNSGKIFTNTILCGAAGAIVGVFAKPHIMGNYSFINQYDVGNLCNGLVCALVAIYAPCDRIEPWAAVIIGSVAAILHSLAAKLLIKIKVDDPVEACAIHFPGGVWGVIATGLFDNQQGAFYKNGHDRGTFFGY